MLQKKTLNNAHTPNIAILSGQVIFLISYKAHPWAGWRSVWLSCNYLLHLDDALAAETFIPAVAYLAFCVSLFANVAVTATKTTPD